MKVAPLPAPLLDMMRELGELKRVRSADRDGSVAQRLFLEAWSALQGGTPCDRAMADNVSRGLAATRLGDIDLPVLHELGLEPDEAQAIVWRAVRDAVTALGAAPDCLVDLPAAMVADTAVAPEFAHRLSRQPRAGVTCPGRPRLLFEPAENHAEHCAIVALYGVLLAPHFDADPATVWLAGLAHHLHNALLPDGGFTGETMLGEQLEPLMRRATDRGLAQLRPMLRETVRAALAVLPDDATPEGRAFHAADTLDRVWQIEQHLRAGSVTMSYVLDDMALVHAGPVHPFQQEVLRAAGLATS